jgi:hypothetical protein
MQESAIVFKNNYTIFISKSAASHFAKWINLSVWLGPDNGVKVLESTDESDDLAVITIPLDKGVKDIEKQLWDFRSRHTQKAVNESGFWGCCMSKYEGKSWRQL